MDSTLKVSPFKGLVLLDIGLVAGRLLGWFEGWPLAEHPELLNHKRWQEPVEGIVRELQRHGIVWGDVNVHNIAVGVNGDAWVIDFGGNCNL
jgi:RIO-like serine/threonine protein kinase